MTNRKYLFAAVAMLSSSAFAADVDNNGQPVIDLKDSLENIEARISWDSDRDGFTTAQGDCDDNDATTYPGAAEITDGIDNNCDGIVDR